MEDADLQKSWFFNFGLFRFRCLSNSYHPIDTVICPYPNYMNIWMSILEYSEYFVGKSRSYILYSSKI